MPNGQYFRAKEKRMVSKDSNLEQNRCGLPIDQTRSCEVCPQRNVAVALTQIPLRIGPPRVRSPHQEIPQGQSTAGQRDASTIGTKLETQRQWFLDNLDNLEQMTWKMVGRCCPGLSCHDRDNVVYDALSFLWHQTELGKCRATKEKVFFAWSRMVVRRKAVELAQGIRKRNRFAMSLDEATQVPEKEDATVLDDVVLDLLHLVPDEDRQGKSKIELFWVLAKKWLPPEQAKAFWYRFDGHMSYKEIGQRLGMASATAKRRVMGATTRLRQILEDYLPGRQ